MRSCLLFALLFAASKLVPAETPRFGLQIAKSPASTNLVRTPVLQPITLGNVLRESALIFSGTVLKVEHLGFDPNRALPITQISLRVENPIRRTRPGQLIKMREWAGLWNAGERYRVGEHVLLFLYPVSKLGLTSPVGRTAGRLHVDRWGTVELGRVPGRTFGAGHPSRIRVKDLAARIRRAERE